MTTAQALYQDLLHLDQRSYKAYKAIEGRYRFRDFWLMVDHVQGDPFAAPSRMRIQIPQATAGFPRALYQTRSREIALRDYLNRQFGHVAAQMAAKRGSGNSGLIAIARPTQQVLERTAVWIDDQQLEVRFTVGLPARGRTILGRQAAELLCDDLPAIVDQALLYKALDAKAIQQHVETVEDADWLRQQLAGQGLVAFIPDGAILPRSSGVDELPLRESVVPFMSPASLRVEFERPNQGKISGMGIPSGVTLIVGGGYHGKSTLLEAISLGVYNHIPDDGREQIVTEATAVKIRAEDGRSIIGVDISPFINHLPQGRSTSHFSSQNASGSTSQAANIMEALEIGAKVLLIDEDTSATNFMIRDRRMQALIAKEQEPITPFVDKIRQLYQDYGVSTVLVMGGSGDYFDVADTVIAMTEFVPSDVTEQAKVIAQTYRTERLAEGGTAFGALTARIPLAKRLDSPRQRRRWGSQGDREYGEDAAREPRRTREDGGASESRRGPRLKVRDVDELVFGSEVVDLTAVEQLVEVGQLRSIGAAITYLQTYELDGQRSLAELIEALMATLAAGLDQLTPYPQGDLAMFRPLELAAVINRLRSLEVQ
ncbi:ABC-ATPase domain-containing protein [Leptolyngbya sp. NK1-12]|uniref:ABC-ATPase domain-containing protein n=1 Tax=Leptolyngbya sp. NK1-12 TaxID=2547451 RepID=A0AA96WIT5_9CYAN|nr:ABC-ATPase domain-containing protein [Leptolyngbya sp. NK1-12]WNZ25914.1 ABC-ATPase domain-containing protein [Leptolyngbya sp. NK1-12]